MSSQVFQQGYKEMSHSGAEGRFLDITDSAERFDLYLNQVDWLDKSTKYNLLTLAQTYVKRFENLNPFAYAMGYAAVTTDDKNNLVITKESLKKSYELLNKSNSYDVYLSDLIEKSDIFRYARLYIKIKNKSKKDGMVVQQFSYDEQQEDEYFNDQFGAEDMENEDDEYNEDDYYNDEGELGYDNNDGDY